MRAEDGAELACRAHEKDFDDGGMPVSRGVISYYAAATLAEATTLRSWQQSIEEMIQADAARGRLTPFYQPTLQVTGDGNLPLIGRPTAAEVLRHGLSAAPTVSGKPSANESMARRRNKAP